MTNNDDLALKSRIEKALTDFTNGRACMHVPAQETDVDLVLANCLEMLEERDADKKRIAELEKKEVFLKERLAQLANFNPDWDMIEAATDSLREHAAELTSANQRIAELEAISAAAEKLVRCKGRYHSEQNYRALAALFGVTTPELPPLEGEARTVSVKLLDCDFAAVQHMSGGSNDYCNGFVDGTQNAIKCVKTGAAAAGINLEVEE